MSGNLPFNRYTRVLTKWVFLILIILLGISFTSCNLFANGDEDEEDSTQKTLIALGIEQTLTAESKDFSTKTAEAGGGIDAGAGGAGGAVLTTPDTAATQAALQPTPLTGETPISPAAQPPADFDAKMKSASILLYEDIVNYPNLPRVVKFTLDHMGLPYDDVGSAKGNFRNKILGGTPSGQPWDLIIVAAEARGGIQGEFFEHLNNALGKGSSIIFEVWHLDQIYIGKASIFLDLCGLSVKNYAGKNRSPNDLRIFPIDGVNHPILNQPNSNISFDNPTPVWAYGDLGDLLSLTGSGSGQLLMGLKPSDSSQNGVLAVCENGKVIMQTFNSHNYPERTMSLQWENYIYNALLSRFQENP